MKFIEFKIQVRKSKTDNDILKMAQRALNELSLYPNIPIFNPRIYVSLKSGENDIDINKRIEVIRQEGEYYKRETDREGLAPPAKFNGLATVNDLKVLFKELISLYRQEIANIEDYRLTSISIYFNLEEEDNSWMAGVDADRIEATFYGKNWKPNIENAILTSIVTIGEPEMYLDKAMIEYLYNKDIITDKFIESIPIRVEELNEGGRKSEQKK